MKEAKFPKLGSFTSQELTEWLDSLDLFTLIAILEKIYKDIRDYAISKHDEDISKEIKKR